MNREGRTSRLVKMYNVPEIVEHRDCGTGAGGRVEAQNRVLSLGDVAAHR